jgi:hypothetical protein
MSLTEAQKNAFNDWFLDMLENADNQAAIVAAKPGITFDTTGTITHLKGKETAYDGKEGIVTAAETALKNANLEANVTLDDWYTASSSAAEAIIGHVGKNHALAIAIRDKRGSFEHASPEPETP